MTTSDDMTRSIWRSGEDVIERDEIELWGVEKDEAPGQNNSTLKKCILPTLAQHGGRRK